MNPMEHRPSGGPAASGASGEAAARRRRVAWMLAAVVLGVGGVAWWLHSRQPSGVASGNPARGKFVLPEQTAVFAAYGGAESCRSCHEKEYRAWAASNHGRAERSILPAEDDAAFVPAREIIHASEKSQARKSGDRLEVVTRSLGGQVEPQVVDRVIGNHPLRQFLVSGPGGRFQALELAWDPVKCEWFDIYGAEDRKPGEWGHWTGRGMNWNAMCAACHNTRLRKNYDPLKDEFHTAMAGPSVSCEACHGPMQAHHSWQQTHAGTGKDPTIQKLTTNQMLDTCGSCHARRGELTGDFKPGDAFFDHYALVVTDDRPLFHVDGQVREENYEFTSFLSSNMHAAGVRCQNCHDPHTAKPVLAGDALCMQCHAAPTPAFPKAPVIMATAHTFHQPESAGARCVNCHMPQTTYMQRHPRHDHGFTIPDPLLTKKTGTPNACNRCHTDKDADWAAGFVQQWHGEKMNRPTRQRALTVDAARRHEEAGRDALLAGLPAGDSPAWQATSALLLGSWAQEDKVVRALSARLQHDSPLVRAAAVHSLSIPAEAAGHPVRTLLRPLLEDPVRSVRMAAAWALRSEIDPDSATGSELLHLLDLNADQPQGRMQLGQYEFARGRLDSAIAQMRKAIEWDPNSPPFHHDLAILLSTAGRPEEAIQALEAASRLDPSSAVYAYQLGLAWNEAGDLPKAVAALENAVRHDPALHRAWYNLGLARNTLGDTAGALAALTNGEKANPRDSALPYARATILLGLGQRAEALAAVRQALDIQPDFPEAYQLLQMLSRTEP